jgi:hypothetical protein
MWHFEPQGPESNLFGNAGSGSVYNEYGTDPQPWYEETRQVI